jgi:hypothetical protein
MYVLQVVFFCFIIMKKIQKDHDDHVKHFCSVLYKICFSEITTSSESITYIKQKQYTYTRDIFSHVNNTIKKKECKTLPVEYTSVNVLLLAYLAEQTTMHVSTSPEYLVECFRPWQVFSRLGPKVRRVFLVSLGQE